MTLKPLQNKPNSLLSPVTLAAFLPLRLTTTATQLVYGSAIALKMGNQWGINPESLAQQLVPPLQKINSLPLGELKVRFSVELENCVWLKLAIAYADLMPWLLWLAESKFNDHSLILSTGLTAPSPFAYFQYVHARVCHSLSLDAGPPPTVDFSEPLLLPLPLRSLLETVMRTLDDWDSQPPQKLALNLSKRLLTFEGLAWQYRLPFSNQQPSMDCVYYLLLIGQKLLNKLLVERLGYAAPREI